MNMHYSSSSFILYQGTKIHHLCTSPAFFISHFGGYLFEFQQLAFCLQEANLRYVEAEKASKQAKLSKRAKQANTKYP